MSWPLLVIIGWKRHATCPLVFHSREMARGNGTDSVAWTRADQLVPAKDEHHVPVVRITVAEEMKVADHRGGSRFQSEGHCTGSAIDD